MEAIILAGGFGKRLAHIVSDVPKPMADIEGRPFLEYLLGYLSQNKVTKVVFAVSYKREFIMNYFGNKYLNIEIHYSEEVEPLGTGGAIKKALSLCTGDNIFIINGDTYFDVNLEDMLRYHTSNNALVTIACKSLKDFDRYGTVLLDSSSGKIVSFVEKGKVTEGLINGGIYLLKREIFDKLDSERFSFEKDFLEKSLHENKIFSYLSDGYFIDIGIPDDYFRAQRELPKLRS